MVADTAEESEAPEALNLARWQRTSIVQGTGGTHTLQFPVNCEL